jgi:hypothetical protein
MLMVLWDGEQCQGLGCQSLVGALSAHSVRNIQHACLEQEVFASRICDFHLDLPLVLSNLTRMCLMYVCVSEISFFHAC